ncbi:DUF429 domain-containing protein [Plesiomonas shigelloides]|uniref:DUF429 domain-containing protein n=1 Tax=Plesiomonas shigelloides TaxID=703 RepID=UPI0031B7CE27
MKLCGIDLAWQGVKNPSGIAIGELNGNELLIESVYPCCRDVKAIIDSEPDIVGYAIDAPLIINNISGLRQCEKELAKVYSSRHASCHPSNLTLYPNPEPVKLAQYLQQKGVKHLGDRQWMLECYPHPTLIEIFSLPERLKYKKGKVVERRNGQTHLANLLVSLEFSPIVKLIIPEHIKHIFSVEYIKSLRGSALKSNEDAIDSVICLYIAALYAVGVTSKTFGNSIDGYIWIPCTKCV